MAVVRAKYSAHVGESLYVNEGELWDADDPLVKERPDMFTDDLSGVTRTSVPPKREAPVEQATAAPGEKRQTRRR